MLLEQAVAEKQRGSPPWPLCPPFSGCLWGARQAALSPGATEEARRGDVGAAELTSAQGEHCLCSQTAGRQRQRGTANLSGWQTETRESAFRKTL